MIKVQVIDEIGRESINGNLVYPGTSFAAIAWWCGVWWIACDPDT